MCIGICMWYCRHAIRLALTKEEGRILIGIRMLRQNMIVIPDWWVHVAIRVERDFKGRERRGRISRHGLIGQEDEKAGLH